jgi:hypothetical protein
MAYGDPYASVLDLETRLGRTDDGTFADLLDTASRAIESFTRRQFNKQTTGPVASARRFRALDPQRLPVDDFHTVTDLAISVNGTAWDITDVEARPPSGIVNGQSGWPFFDLLTIARTWPPGRRAKVTVTAHWGWNAIPEAIRQATLDVAEIMSYGGGGGSGVVRSEALDGYSVSYGVPTLTGGATIPVELVKAAPYRRVRFGVA